MDVNEELQPISNSARQLSSLIGCLARDPKRLPLDYFDWRKMEQEKKDALWQEVKVCKKSSCETRNVHIVVYHCIHI